MSELDIWRRTIFEWRYQIGPGGIRTLDLTLRRHPRCPFCAFISLRYEPLVNKITLSINLRVYSSKNEKIITSIKIITIEMLLYFIKLTYNEWYIQDLLQKDNKQLEVDLRDSKHKIIWWWRALILPNSWRFY